MRSASASEMLAASFVCAGATVRYIRQLSPQNVTFVVTGIAAQIDGDEDRACAEYMAALFQDGAADPTPYLVRVAAAVGRAGALHPERAAMLAADVPYCTAVDRFPFAMRVDRRQGLHVMSPVIPA